jgi:hypothetical protein
MKLILILSLFVTSTFALSSCKHGNDDPAPVVNTNTPGSGWRVTRFTEPGEDKTNDYNGYVFEYASNGTATVTGNGQSSTGNWSQSVRDGLNRFNIQIGSTDKKIEKLNHDWVLQTKSDSFISMTDDNASSDEHLEFSK